MDDPAILEAREKLRQAEGDLQRAYQRMIETFQAHLDAFAEYETAYGELPPIYMDPGNPKTSRLDAALQANRQAEKDRDDARRRINEAQGVLSRAVAE